MTWPFEVEKKPEIEVKPKEEQKPPEKTPAELIAESLKPVTDGFAALSTRLDAIEQATKKPEKKPEPTERVEPTSVLDDENLAFAQRMTPLMLRQLEVEARIVKGEIRAEYTKAGYGDLWDQFEAEIDAVLNDSPVVNAQGAVLRGSPDYIRNVVDMVMGRNARKAGMRFDGKSKGFFLETGGGGAEQNKPPENDGLTEGQRKVFGRMKVPLDDAKKVMAKLKFVS